jgi:hypothetical protein
VRIFQIRTRTLSESNDSSPPLQYTAAGDFVLENDQPITSFRGEYEFLSNFFAHPITLDGEIYPTAEHAFQALKTLQPAERLKVRETPTPYAVKRVGKRVTLREGWDSLRFEVMERVVRAKFADPDLAARLRETGERELIEGNTWRDTTWGCVRAADGGWKGQNRLGKILMQVRAELALPPWQNKGERGRYSEANVE